MANQLKMAMIGSILTLRRQGLSGRRIADLLGVNRETVSRYLRLARAMTGRTGAETQPPEAGAALHPAGLEASNPAIAPFGPEVSNSAIAPLGSNPPEPQDPTLLLLPSLRAGPSSRCEPYRAVYRQTTEEFIRCLENAFRQFGGVPRTLVIDNLRAAVTQADGFDPQLNPKVRSFCEHYGTVILPTRPYTPRHKGKFERGIGYVKNNALKGRTFESLADQNRHLREWEQTVADTRIHGTTRRQVGQVFQSVERTALQPLPPDLFPSFAESRRKVNRDGHVEVVRAYYSVPPEHLGREVWARWDARVVRLFNASMQPIAVHVRQEPGRFSSQDRHVAPEKISGVEQGSVWLLTQVRRVGPATGRWAEAMLESRGLEGVRVLMRSLHLTRRHDGDSLERACEVAQTHGAYRLRVIREEVWSIPVDGPSSGGVFPESVDELNASDHIPQQG